MENALIQNTTEPTASSLYTTSQPAIRPRYLFIITLYCVIMLVSLVGNSLIFAVVYRNENKRMRTISNYFIVNMSCSDLLFTFCNVPFFIASLITDDLPIGEKIRTGACKLTLPLFYLYIEVSLLSLVVITVDRFLLVFYPHKRIITARRARILIGTIWLVGAVFTSPMAAHATSYEYRRYKFCYLGLSVSANKAYFTTCLIVFLVLPLVTMVVLYSSIVVKLFRQKPPGENSIVNQEHSNKRNRKVLLMLATIVTLTIVCWLPYWSAYIDCILALASKSCNSIVYLRVLMFANCALNPCVYIIFNENFRVGFYRVLCSVFCPECIRSSCCQNQVFPNRSASSRDNSLALRS